LVGVPVQPRWREMLIKLSDDVLREVQQVPSGTFYRASVENNFKFFKSVLEKHDDYEEVEEILNRGQVEELIMQFEDELEIIPHIVRERPWEVTQDSANQAKKVESMEDFVLPGDYEKPDLEFTTWSGVYNVTPSEAEWVEMDRKEAEAAAAEKERLEKLAAAKKK